ncbi:hypothetical protein VDG1235_2049 [Verrucomicrobiia bacterium DG1235]|nr:hypothetical protein VDG1235_2049 [Verrucomicrobiae bacterium DG1235]
MKDNPLIQSALAATLLGVVSHCSAADGTLEAAISSIYVDRGLEMADLTWHPSLELSQGNVYGGLWAALPLENRSRPETIGDQYDVYAGYGWAAGDKLAIDLGGTLSFTDGFDETFEGYVGLVGEFGTFSPSIYIYNDFDLDAFTVEASTSVAVPLDVFPFQATIRAGLVEADVDYRYYGLDLLYPVELGPSSRLLLGLHYSDNDFGAGMPDNSLYGSAAVRLRF